MKKALYMLLATAIAGTALADIRMARTGSVQAGWLDELSGIQASRKFEGKYWALNDSGKPRLGLTDETGADLGRFKVKGADHRDWEDLTLVPRPEHDLLVVADTGNNGRLYASVSLYFVEEPQPGSEEDAEVFHRIELEYPDYRHDTEAVAWDPLGQRILLLDKRSLPPRLYAIGLEEALGQDKAVLEYLGEINSFRPPAPEDTRTLGKRAKKASMPTGMDISPDGQKAAVITYRSLYLFDLPESGDWLDGLRSKPLEIIGPPSRHEEAVTFTFDGSGVLIGGEGENSGLYLLELAPVSP